MKRSKIWLRLLAAAAAAVLMCCAGCDRPAGKIDFTQTQPKTTPAAAASSVQPLRIAFASVMSPKETRQSYQKFVSHISQELQKPAVLLQKRTYEELNKLMDNGGADIAFFSTGAYSAYRGKTPIELLAMTQTNESVLYQTPISSPPQTATSPTSASCRAGSSPLQIPSAIRAGRLSTFSCWT